MVAKKYALKHVPKSSAAEDFFLTVPRASQKDVTPYQSEAQMLGRFWLRAVYLCLRDRKIIQAGRRLRTSSILLLKPWSVTRSDQVVKGFI